eukprot:gene30953-40279_t
MVDYSKFNNIHDSDDEDENNNSHQEFINSNPSEITPGISPKPAPVPMAKKGKEGRLKFEYNGRTIYEWEQSLSEVNIYIEPPPGVRSNMFEIIISHRHLKVGLKSAPPFLDEETGGPVKPDESMWTLVDGEININLQKMNKAEMWEAALVGHNGQKIDAFTKEEVKKKLMIERFQEEHPGFDFSGAEFNGSVPDARDFMGGVKHF